MSKILSGDNGVPLLHRSYVLRCLPVGGETGTQAEWRFTIEEAEPNSRRLAFSSLDGLVRFLQSEFQAQARQGVEGAETS